ncbi:sugar transferase [candidate division KSB1 bacterium]|nr:sugar transferase [candidate division KSB1 bacterium]
MSKKKILYISNGDESQHSLKKSMESEFEVILVDNGLKGLTWVDQGNTPDTILCDVYVPGTHGFHILKIVRNTIQTRDVPFIMLSKTNSPEDRKRAVKEGANDFFVFPYDPEKIILRAKTLIALAEKKASPEQEPDFVSYKMPLAKRIFDILVSSLAILFLSPILFLLAILIKLESRGPVFYKSKRAGSGYEIFTLYKFRTMFINADEKLAELMHLNVYAHKEVPVVVSQDAREISDDDSALLYDDGGKIAETTYLQERHSSDNTFFKLAHDPRITPLGRFLRKTSLDEIPQLFNVLKGEMSLVGNRPLPLYEAEKLTTDNWSERFLAPAGLTGLWQVTKRGKMEMSEQERIDLDNQYAKNCTFWGDIKIILKTFPAVLHHEDV